MADASDSSELGSRQAQSAARRASDLDLVRRVLAGDPKAREEFAECMQCIPRYLAAANARYGNPIEREDLADLAQDTLVVVWRKLATYEGRATLVSWTWRFCQLEFANRLRRQYRRGTGVAAPVEDLDDPALVVHDPVPQDLDQLEGSLQALGPPEEDVIRLKHFEHLMFADVAERLGISENTAKSRYYRGMAWLRDRLRRGHGGETS